MRRAAGVIAGFLAVLGTAHHAHALMRGDMARDPDGVRRAAVSIETPEGLCSGTLIGPRLVVTAAHCVARTGSYRLLVAERNFRMRPMGVRRVQLHGGFDVGNGFSPDDIGLIELTRPAPAGMVPMAIADRTAAMVQDGESLLVAGFGSTESRAAREGILRQASMEASESSVPGRSFSGLRNAEGRRASGMCVGDSGGPVLRRSETGFVLIGILKGGTTEGHKECTSRPVYTPVGPYHAWIAKAAADWGLALGAGGVAQEMKQ